MGSGARASLAGAPGVRADIALYNFAARVAAAREAQVWAPRSPAVCRVRITPAERRVLAIAPLQACAVR